MIGSGGNRHIVVTVSSNIASFTAGMNSVRSQLSGLQTSAASTLGALSNGIGNIANQMILTGAAGTGFSQYFIRMFGDALPAVEEYYKAQAKLLSLIDHGEESYKNMSRAVWEAAKEQSEASIYTAAEITNSWYVIGQAGYENFEDIKRISEATTKLATAQAADITQTTEDVITVLKAYDIAATDSWKVTNLLAAGATVSKVSMDDYHDGLKYIVTAFSALNVSIEDTITSFTTLTDVGYTGQNAGRILRDALNDLLNPTAEAMEVLRKYNVQLYTNQSVYDSLASTYDSIGSVITGLKGQQEELNDAMQASRDITEELNMAQQQLSIDAAKIRLKYNEENPLIKSLEREKDAMIDARDAAKDYYNELKQAKKERQADINDQKSVVSDVRHQITAINQQMSFNRAQGYKNDTPTQVGLTEEKKRLQDELAKEQNALDGLKKTQDGSNKAIDAQKEKVTAANEKIADQNKKLKTEKEKAAEAEQKELNVIEKKKIAIDEEKLAQQKKYNLIEDEQRKINKQVDEYNLKLQEAKKNMDAFVPEGLKDWSEILKSLKSTGLSDSESEMGKVFGKQSGGAIAYLAKQAGIGNYDERKADLTAKEGTYADDPKGEANRQNQMILDSFYGQETIARTKYQNTDLGAVQNNLEPLKELFTAIGDDEMMNNITKIKGEMLGGMIEAAEDALPKIKDAVDWIAKLPPEVKETIGKLALMSTFIMLVVSPALLTLGVSLSMLKLAIDPLVRILGGGAAANALGAAGGSRGKVSTAAGTIYDPWLGDGRGGANKKLKDFNNGVNDDEIYRRFGPKYKYDIDATPLGPFDTRTDFQKNEAMYRQKRSLYNYGSPIYDYETSGGQRPLKFDTEYDEEAKKWVEKKHYQPGQLSTINRTGKYKYDLDIDPIDVGTPRTPMFGPLSGKGKGGKSVVDPKMLAELDLLDKKLNLKPKGLVNSLDDIAIAGSKALPVTKNVGTEVGILGSIAARIAPMIGMGGGAAATSSVAGGIASVGIAGTESTGIIATVGTTLSTLALPITLIIAAIALLYLAWTNNFMGIQDQAANFMKWVEKNFGWIREFIDRVVTDIKKTLDTFLGGFQDVFDGIMNLDLTQIGEGLGKIAGSFFRFFGQVIWYAAEFIGDFVWALIQGVATGGPDFLSALAAFLSDIPNMLISFGQVVLFSAAEFGMSFINALMGVEETDAQREDRKRKVAAMMDDAYKSVGLNSNLSGYVDDTNAKRTKREADREAQQKELTSKYTETGIKGADKANEDLIDSTDKATKANKDFSKSNIEMTSTVKSGIAAGKSNAEILKELGFTNVDTSKSLNGLTTDLGRTNTGLGTVTSGATTTREAVEQLKAESDKKLLAPNYDQAKFNTFNQQINNTTANLQRMQSAAANANVAAPTTTQAPVPLQTAVTAVPKAIVGSAPTVTVTPKVSIPNSQAAGTNIVKQIGKGVADAVGFINKPMGWALQTIVDHLPNSPAKVGPLTKLPLYGGNIVKQIAEGMLSEKDTLGNAAEQTASVIKKNMDAKMFFESQKKMMNEYREASKVEQLWVTKQQTLATPKQQSLSHNQQIANSQGASGVHNENFQFTFNGAQNKQDLTKFGKQLVKKMEHGRGNFKSMG